MGSGNELVDYSRAPCLGADQKARGLWERDCETRLTELNNVCACAKLGRQNPICRSFVLIFCSVRSMFNLVPRAHVPFGQHQDTELWNNQFPETKILGLPASRRMRGLV